MNANLTGQNEVRRQLALIMETLRGRADLIETALSMPWPGKEVGCSITAEGDFLLHGTADGPEWWMELRLGALLTQHSPLDDLLRIYVKHEAPSDDIRLFLADIPSSQALGCAASALRQWAGDSRV